MSNNIQDKFEEASSLVTKAQRGIVLASSILQGAPDGNPWRVVHCSTGRGSCCDVYIERDIDGGRMVVHRVGGEITAGMWTKRDKTGLSKNLSMFRPGCQEAISAAIDWFLDAREDMMAASADALTANATVTMLKELRAVEGFGAPDEQRQRCECNDGCAAPAAGTVKKKSGGKKK